MSLEALLEPLPDRGSKPCKLASIIASLEDPYKSALERLVETPWKEGGLSDTQLRERLLKAGLSLGVTVIHYHRRGICSCKGVVG